MRVNLGFLVITLFSIILFSVLVHFLSFPHLTELLFPYFGKMAGTEIQVVFWDGLNPGYAT